MNIDINTRTPHGLKLVQDWMHRYLLTSSGRKKIITYLLVGTFTFRSGKAMSRTECASTYVCCWIHFLQEEITFSSQLYLYIPLKKKKKLYVGAQWSGLALFFWRTSCIMTFIFFTPLVAFEFKVHFLHLKSISEDLNLSWLMLVVYYRHLHLSLNLGGHWGSTTSFFWFTLFPLPSGFHEPWAWPVHSVILVSPPPPFTVHHS